MQRKFSHKVFTSIFSKVRLSVRLLKMLKNNANRGEVLRRIHVAALINTTQIVYGKHEFQTRVIRNAILITYLVVIVMGNQNTNILKNAVGFNNFMMNLKLKQICNFIIRASGLNNCTEILKCCQYLRFISYHKCYQYARYGFFQPVHPDYFIFILFRGKKFISHCCCQQYYPDIIHDENTDN